MKKILSISLSTLLFAGFMISAFSFTPLKSITYAQRWEKLGEIKTLFNEGKAQIEVRPSKSFFKALQLKVRGGAVTIQKMVVYFRNGKTKEIEIRNNFEDGSDSRIIDLPGNRRVIEKIVVWYQVTPTGRKPTVELWGRH